MRRAFTLLEVLLAIALVAVLAGGVVSFLFGMLERREALTTESERRAVAGVVFEEVEGMLATTMVTDSRGGAGIVGTGTTLTVRGRGVPVVAGAGARSGIGDEVGVEFAFDAASGEVRGTRLGPAGGTAEVVGGGAQSLRIRYHDGREWRSEFDSAKAGVLPRAVEISLWFGEADAEAEPPRRAPDRVRTIAVPDAAGGGDA